MCRLKGEQPCLARQPQIYTCMWFRLICISALQKALHLATQFAPFVNRISQLARQKGALGNSGLPASTLIWGLQDLSFSPSTSMEDRKLGSNFDASNSSLGDFTQVQIKESFKSSKCPWRMCSTSLFLSVKYEDLRILPKASCQNTHFLVGFIFHQMNLPTFLRLFAFRENIFGVSWSGP